MHQLIPADSVLFEEGDLQNRLPVADQYLFEGEHQVAFVGPEPEPVPEIWAARETFLPYSYWARTGDVAAVIRWSDFYSQTELKNQPFYDLLRQDSTHRYAINVPLPAPAGWTRKVGFFRTHRDFSERDRLALQLLRPHLHEVYLDVERRRHGIPRLSRRECEVLQLAAQGHSNADIAQILFISPATAAKHMEHIFDRTGVRTRSAAAALALPQVRPFTQPSRQLRRGRVSTPDDRVGGRPRTPEECSPATPTARPS